MPRTRPHNDATALEVNAASRPLRVAIIAGLLLSALCVVASHFDSHPYDVDSGSYIILAEGRLADVHKPFSNRFLSPAVVRSAVHLGVATRDHAFEAIAVASLLCFSICCALIETLAGLRPLAIVPLLFMPGLLHAFEDIYLPDFPHAALLALLLAMLMAERFGWSIVIIFLMQLTREATLLLVLVLAVTSWRCSRKTLAVGTLLSCGVGMAMVGALTRNSASNVHDLANGPYAIGKVIFNFAGNVLGVRLWTDSLQSLASYTPIWAINVPHWLHIGRIHRVGILAFELRAPLGALSLWLTAFGVLPAATVAAVRSRRMRLWERPLWLQTAIVYGAASFILGPALGASIDRLVFYGWPLCVATPFLLSRLFVFDSRSIAALIAANAVVCWLPVAVDRVLDPSLLAPSITLVIALVMHVVAYRHIARLPARDERGSPALPTDGPPAMA